jgi:hypothetical protein
MQDSLIFKVDDAPPKINKISIHTPIGSVDTGDDNPVLDYLVVCLVFMGFCLWIYVRFFRILKK